MLNKFTRHDLETLIDQKIEEAGFICSPRLHEVAQTDEGKKRIKTRVLQIIFDDGITSIEAALAHLESELSFTE